MQRSRNGNERFQVTSKLFYVVSRVMHKQETIGNNGWEAPESVNTSFCNNRGWDAAITGLCGDRNWFWVLAFVRGYTSCPFFFLFFFLWPFDFSWGMHVWVLLLWKVALSRWSDKVGVEWLSNFLKTENGAYKCHTHMCVECVHLCMCVCVRTFVCALMCP